MYASAVMMIQGFTDTVRLSYGCYLVSGILSEIYVIVVLCYRIDSAFLEICSEPTHVPPPIHHPLRFAPRYTPPGYHPFEISCTGFTAISTTFQKFAKKCYCVFETCVVFCLFQLKS